MAGVGWNLRSHMLGLVLILEKVLRSGIRKHVIKIGFNIYQTFFLQDHKNLSRLISVTAS